MKEHKCIVSNNDKKLGKVCASSKCKTCRANDILWTKQRIANTSYRERVKALTILKVWRQETLQRIEYFKRSLSEE